jgi:hypothetical protein
MALWAIARRNTQRRRAICTAVANALVAVAYVPIWAMLLVPLTPQSDYPLGLEYGSPRLPIYRPEYGPEYLVFSRYTADELNRLRQDPSTRAQLFWPQSQDLDITYVPADVPSDGPLVVSVNAIDDYTWGAAARSDRTGRCYLVVLVRERESPRYGHTRDGVLTDGLPCTGSAATPATT